MTKGLIENKSWPSENESWDLFFFHKNFAAGRSAISSSRLCSLSNDHFCLHQHHHHHFHHLPEQMNIKFQTYLFCPAKHTQPTENTEESKLVKVLKMIDGKTSSPSTMRRLGHLVKFSARSKILVTSTSTSNTSWWPKGSALGPSGLLHFVLRALRALSTIREP